MLNEIPGIKTNKPEGAFYVFMDVTELLGKEYDGTIMNNGSDLANYLLDKIYVATVGGDAFGNSNCIRISYATSKEKLIEACNRLKKLILSINQ
jgi:aspartate aminotransferase